MKKRIIGLVIMGLVLLGQPSQAAFGGFRVGGALGVQLLQGKHFYTGPTTPISDMKKRLSSLSYMMGFHGGYLFELGSSKFVVGLEAYFLMPGANPSFDLNLVGVGGTKEGSVSIKHKRSMGIAATIGMMLNPKIMGYLNLGLESALFELKYQFKFTGQGNIPAQQTFNPKLNAFTPGLGVVYKISPHFLIGLELSSPFFKRFKARMDPPRAYHYKPVERRLLFKVSYLF